MTDHKKPDGFEPRESLSTGFVRILERLPSVIDD